MDLKAACEYLAQSKQAMLDLTIKLADINSGSYHVAGIQKVAKLLKQEMASLNCEYVAMPLAPQKIIDEKGELHEAPLGDVMRFWKRPQAQYKYY